MAVRNDFIVFVTMLLTLAVPSSGLTILASKSDDFNHPGCYRDDASHLGACYHPGRYNHRICGQEYSVTCVGDGAGGDNPCNGDGKNSVSVIMVGPCKNAYEAYIQLSSIAYNNIVSDRNSLSIIVAFVHL